MAQPRGIRNCNPGNIRLSGDKWKGLRPRQTDGEFCQFTDMAHGYRALIRLLQNYRKLHGCRTIADFIRRWAFHLRAGHGRPRHDDRLCGSYQRSGERHTGTDGRHPGGVGIIVIRSGL